MVYGYARVSTHWQAKEGNSLAFQYEELRTAGAKEIFSDAFTGTVTERPELDKLLGKMKDGDTIVVTKLDRIARNVKQGLELIDGLNERGIKVHVLNMGIIDSTPTGRLIRNIMLSFAEWERDMIIQRTFEGKQRAKQRPGFRDGRPPKYTEEQLSEAMQMLDTYSYTEVASRTGISKATLVRCKAKLRSAEYIL